MTSGTSYQVIVLQLSEGNEVMVHVWDNNTVDVYERGNKNAPWVFAMVGTATRFDVRDRSSAQGEAEA